MRAVSDIGALVELSSMLPYCCHIASAFNLQCFLRRLALQHFLWGIIRFGLGSKTNRPTTRMAAELVVPAPKTPLVGISVLPSITGSIPNSG